MAVAEIMVNIRCPSCGMAMLTTRLPQTRHIVECMNRTCKLYQQKFLQPVIELIPYSE